MDVIEKDGEENKNKNKNERYPLPRPRETVGKEKAASISRNRKIIRNIF